MRLESLTLDQNSRELYEQFVPENHPLRKMDEAIDFSFILPLVAHKYDLWIGRPAEHPERMWHLLFAQYYLNLSDEKVILAAHESLALRLFLRLDGAEKPPHLTTLGKFRSNRPVLGANDLTDEERFTNVKPLSRFSLHRSGTEPEENYQQHDTTALRWPFPPQVSCREAPRGRRELSSRYYAGGRRSTRGLEHL